MWTFSSFTAPSQGCQSLSDAFFLSSYPVMWECFLKLWLNKRSSANFQLVSCENCSTCRYIFDMFVEQVSSTSSYSTILISSPIILKICTTLRQVNEVLILITFLLILSYFMYLLYFMWLLIFLVHIQIYHDVILLIHPALCFHPSIPL